MVRRIPGKHYCHAKLCNEECKPEKLMCWKHWCMVPYKIQQAVYKYYRAGQCDDKEVSIEWLMAADAAIASVALQEGISLNNDEIKAALEYGLQIK